MIRATCKTVILLICCNILGGCFNASRVPEDHFYKLPQPSSVPQYRSKLPQIAVATMRAHSLHGERALLYVEADQPLEIKRYHYHHWVDSPIYLIRDYLIEYLAQSGAAPNIVRYEPGEHYAGVIRGRITALERVVENSGSLASVGLELEYENHKTGQRVHKEYAVKQPITEGSMHATVEAFGQALEKIFADFTQNSLGDVAEH